MPMVPLLLLAIKDSVCVHVDYKRLLYTARPCGWLQITSARTGLLCCELQATLRSLVRLPIVFHELPRSLR